MCRLISPIGSGLAVNYEQIVGNESAEIIDSALAAQLLKNGYGFRGYAEDLPEIGSTINRSGSY
jgi:hypothetical protein